MRGTLKPDTETIQSDPAYQLIYELGFQDVIPFVLAQIRKRNFFSAFYFASNLGLLLMIIILSTRGLSDHSLGWKELIIKAISGFLAGSFLIIPIHELLHALAYRILGARKIIFGADLSQLIFYVTADRYPVSGYQIHLLTMTPFVLINLIVAVLTGLVFHGGLLLAGFFLLSHNMMCIGDFAISGFISGKGGKIYTYDEPERKMSYFYQKT